MGNIHTASENGESMRKCFDEPSNFGVAYILTNSYGVAPFEYRQVGHGTRVVIRYQILPKERGELRYGSLLGWPHYIESYLVDHPTYYIGYNTNYK